jgi:putative transposase
MPDAKEGTSMQRFKGSGLHKGRWNEINQIYLLTLVTEQCRSVFTDWPRGRLLVEQLKACDEAQLSHSLAWVIMPDRLHWLLQLKSHTLGHIVCRVKSRSSLAINRQEGAKGRLWQKGYRDRAMRRDDNLQAIARYLIRNPQRAGLSRGAGDYPLWDAAWL